MKNQSWEILLKVANWIQAEIDDEVNPVYNKSLIDEINKIINIESENN